MFTLVRCLWQELVELLLYARSRKWVTVPGTVGQIYIGEKETKANLVEVMVAYMYHFQDRPYTGSITRTPVVDAKKMIGRFHRNAPVALYVNPNRPQESYLPSGEPWSESLLVWIPTIALFAAVFYCGLLFFNPIPAGVGGVRLFVASVVGGLLLALLLFKLR